MNFTLPPHADPVLAPLSLQVANWVFRRRLAARLQGGAPYQGNGAAFAHRVMGPVLGRLSPDAMKKGGCIVASGTGMFFV